jgi:hypothetical protein
MSKKRLLLVGWDSADWKIMHPMIDAGHLSGVARLNCAIVLESRRYPGK